MENLVGGPGFWGGRPVLVTGHTGFKGSWLTLWLERLGARVSGLALPPPTNPAMFNVIRAEESLERSAITDIRDAAAMASIVSDVKPEIIFHLAGQPIVLHAYQQPVETLTTNVLGTAHVLEAVRATPSVRAVVVVTSDKCYENREWVWGYRESDAMGGHDPYSASKGCAELVTAAWRSSFFNQEICGHHGAAVASVRAGNVIGGGDWAAHRLIPDLIRSLIAGEPTQIRHPNAVRPWQHVLEPLSGYLCLARRLIDDGPAYAEAWNFGPLEANDWPVGRIADAVTALWSGVAAGWVADPRPRPHESCHLKLECSKAAARLGWHPIWNTRTALDETIDWYRRWRDGADMREVTLSQIKRYETLIR